MKNLWESLKKDFVSMLLLVIIGFGFGKVYANFTVLQDCKVLGMTRFGDTPMGCRVGEKYQ